MATVGKNINGYTIIKVLTIGNFCTSYEAQKGEVVYFLKEYYNPTTEAYDQKTFINSQGKIGSKLKLMGHRVERVVDSFETGGQYYLVKEFIKGVNLKEWMTMNTSPTVRWMFAIQVCEIVSAIHKEGIIHQDLKPSQFMVVVDSTSECGFSLILTDFDWAIVDDKVVKKVGTLYYGNVDKAVSCKTDTLSLGVILSELLVGRKPYHIDNVNIFNSIDDAKACWRNLVLSKSFTEPISIDPTNISRETNNIIVKCLNPKAENRPNVEEIVTVLNLDKKRFKPTTTPISMLAPHLNINIEMGVINPTPALGVQISGIKRLSLMHGGIKPKGAAVRVDMPKASPVYKSLGFHIPSIKMLRCNIAHLLER